MRFLAVLVAFLLGWGRAEVWGVYTGTLGSLPIVLSLDKADAEEGGRYFYVKYGLDLRLGVRVQGERVTLTEFAPPSFEMNGPQVSAIFEGTLRGDTLAGTWRSTDGARRWPFRLSRAQVANVLLAVPESAKLRALRKTDPYAFLKVNRPLSRVAVRTQGGVRVETWREAVSGATFPRLLGLPNRAAQDRVNARLADAQIEGALDALQCRSDAGARGGDWGQTVRVTYLSLRLLSLRTDTGYSCGGAHPDSFTEGETYDLRSGQPLDLAKALARELPDLARRKALTRADPECAEVLRGEGAAESAAVFLTRSGVLVQLNLPHVVAACVEDAVELPWPELRALLKPGSLLRSEFLR